MITAHAPHGAYPDRRDNLAAALNEAPTALAGWPRFDRVHPHHTGARDARLDAMWRTASELARADRGTGYRWRAAA